ncbi:MAG: hypothetical protein QNJ54_17635 [Prochloraceae cyanobacterium]|nr:hypothetical protein [Prochloraceae cyanobacterium]
MLIVAKNYQNIAQCIEGLLSFRVDRITAHLIKVNNDRDRSITPIYDPENYLIV